MVLFELTQVRWLLLVFPNTFEYFFDVYEAVRTRWDPRRMSRGLLIGAAAFIWIFIKLPQEWWIHVAQLDLTDFLKEAGVRRPRREQLDRRRGGEPDGGPGGRGWRWRCSALLGWWVLTRRLPPADRPFTLDADSQQPAVDKVAIRRATRPHGRRPSSIAS